MTDASFSFGRTMTPQGFVPDMGSSSSSNLVTRDDSGNRVDYAPGGGSTFASLGNTDTMRAALYSAALARQLQASNALTAQANSPMAQQAGQDDQMAQSLWSRYSNQHSGGAHAFSHGNQVQLGDNPVYESANPVADMDKYMQTAQATSRDHALARLMGNDEAGISQKPMVNDPQFLKLDPARQAALWKQTYGSELHQDVAAENYKKEAGVKSLTTSDWQQVQQANDPKTLELMDATLKRMAAFHGAKNPSDILNSYDPDTSTWQPAEEWDDRANFGQGGMKKTVARYIAPADVEQLKTVANKMRGFSSQTQFDAANAAAMAVPPDISPAQRQAYSSALMQIQRQTNGRDPKTGGRLNPQQMSAAAKALMQASQPQVAASQPVPVQSANPNMTFPNLGRQAAKVGGGIGDALATGADAFQNLFTTMPANLYIHGRNAIARGLNAIPNIQGKPNWYGAGDMLPEVPMATPYQDTSGARAR